MASDPTTLELCKAHYLREYLADNGHEVPSNGHMKCPNPSHADNNPSAQFYPNENGRAIVKCFGGCGAWDIFKLHQLLHGGSFKEAKAALCARFGMEQHNHTQHTGGGIANVSQNLQTMKRGILHLGEMKPNANTQAHIMKCSIALQAGADAQAGREYLRGRGITDETARKFGVGFDAAAGWTEGQKGGIVIPSGAGYVVRFLHEQQKKDGGKCKVMFLPKGTPRPVFNVASIRDAKKSNTPVFIVEGEMDVLTITQCGGVAIAVPVNGTGYVIEAAKEIGGGVYVPCMDRDAKGETAQAKLEAGLSAIVGATVYKGAAVELLPDRTDGTHAKDANEELQADAAGLAARVAAVIGKAVAQAKDEQKKNAPYHTLADVGEPIPEEENPRAIFNGGYLRKGGGIIAASTAGAGKSTFSVQCALHWVMGLPCLGISPVRVLRVCIIQAEDDIDEERMFKVNMRKGLTAEGWTQEQIAQAFERLIFRDDFLGKTGTEFAEKLREMQTEEHYDLVIVNPLNSYFEGDISLNADATQFFRKMIDPVIKAPNTECGILFIHHSGKPPKGKDAAQFGKGAFAQYSMQGAAELNNWARAVLVLYPFENNTEFWTLTAAKRHKPLGWTDADGKPTKDLVIAYSSDCVYWRKPSAEEVAEAKSGAQTAKPEKQAETGAEAVQRFVKHVCEKYKNGISLTLAREVARDLVKRPNSELIMGWLGEHPEQYGLHIEQRSERGKNGRKKTAAYLIPNENAGLFDGTDGAGTGTDATPPEIGTSPDTSGGEIEQDEDEPDDIPF